MGDRFGRWLGVSLVVHLLVSVGYIGFAASGPKKPPRPLIHARYVPMPGTKGTGMLSTAPPAPPAPTPAAVTPPPAPAKETSKPKQNVQEKTSKKETQTKKVPAKDVKKTEKPLPEPAKPKGRQDPRTGGHKGGGKIETPAAPASALPGGGSASIGVDGADFTYSYYLVTIQSAIAREWNAVGAAARSGELYAVVYFQVERDGRIIRPEIESSSGDALFDQAALRAVQRAALPPLPAEFAETLLGIHFQFEYAP